MAREALGRKEKTENKRIKRETEKATAEEYKRLGPEGWFNKYGFYREGNPATGKPLTNAADCGTGAGGFKPGNQCAVGGSSRSITAKISAKRVDRTIQRYSEEHNEPAFALKIGGFSFKDNELVDVVVGSGGIVKHGIELKTMVDNSNNKITMKGDAMARKRKWARQNKAQIHTVVIDDRNVFNAKGKGKHDESKRVYYYRRGVGSFRVQNMYRVEGGINELKTLLDTPKRQLPKGAK